jgi:hypothetical protein
MGLLVTLRLKPMGAMRNQLYGRIGDGDVGQFTAVFRRRK